MQKSRHLSPWFLATSITCNTLAANPAPDRLTFVETAPGIYLHLGKHQDMSIDNFGDIANIGFIIGTKSVAVIDPGGSPALGQAMRRAIQDHTQLPISHVILTHMHPDHVFGGAAFSDVKQIVAHRNYASALAQRGSFYRDAYGELFSDRSTSVSLLPSVSVIDELQIDLGERPLIIRAHATAHTDNDLSVFDSTTATLWASDLIFNQRIPSLDGSLTGWLKVMDDLSLLQAKLVIPGHGPPGPWSSIAPAQYQYLEIVLAQTRQFIAQDKRLAEAVERIAVSESSNWKLFDVHHKSNITKAYTELEWE